MSESNMLVAERETAKAKESNMKPAGNIICQPSLFMIYSACFACLCYKNSNPTPLGL